MTQPILPGNFRLLELLIRRGSAFLWDSALPGIPCLVLLHFRPNHPAWIGWAFLAFFFAYETTALIRSGRGLGKKMTQLILRTADGRKLEPGQAALRTAIKVGCLSPLFAFTQPDFGWALTAGLFLAPYVFLDEHCFLHDLRSDSRVDLQG